jgi:hypothetical protein
VNKICRQEDCESEVDRPNKRADCDKCFNRLRREQYKNDKDYREKIKGRNTARRRTSEGRASRMLSDAKVRASKRGVKFNIELEDILVPVVCPYLSIPLNTGNDCKRDNSPTLDRIVPELGYVKGNVEVISERANRIKNDATPEELEMIAKRYKELKEKMNESEL